MISAFALGSMSEINVISIKFYYPDTWFLFSRSRPQRPWKSGRHMKIKQLDVAAALNTLL